MSVGEDAGPRPKRHLRERPPPAGSTVARDQPLVAIVGYPNVGKSTLFNRLSGRREAVVDAMPGVTRDRRQAGADWNGVAFQLMDTGGIDEADPTPIGRQVTAQAAQAIEEADLLLFVVDVTVAPTPGDLELADRLRRADRPVIVVANKCDDWRNEPDAQALWSLGIGEVVPVSAVHGRGSGELLDEIVARLPQAPPADLDRVSPPSISIIGRPNVGKSSILNAILGEERAVVHDARPRGHAVGGRRPGDRPHRHRGPAPARQDRRGRGALQPAAGDPGGGAQRRGDRGLRGSGGHHGLGPLRGRPGGARALRHAARRQQVGPRAAGRRGAAGARAAEVAPAPADRGLLGGHR
jgi:small GTP-binding protein